MNVFFVLPCCSRPRGTLCKERERVRRHTGYVCYIARRHLLCTITGFKNNGGDYSSSLLSGELIFPPLSCSLLCSLQFVMLNAEWNTRDKKNHYLLLILIYLYPPPHQPADAATSSLRCSFSSELPRYPTCHERLGSKRRS